jgi:vacuolar-type H+-ATPase subunit E/Vma4
MKENIQLILANEFVQFTDRNVFLTGKAGTGKTTFLHKLKANCPKRMVIVAPTGVAAINAGGVTIHSFFQLPFGPFIPDNQNDKTNQKTSFQHKIGKDKINLMKSLDLLVIDEISMVRADTLDGIDEVLRRYRDRTKPFGGVQLLMIGDLHQLSPVVKDDDWRILKEYYENLYFFNSRALKETLPLSIELKHIYRQSDTFFIDLLNKVRENKMDAEVLEQLNQRFIPDFNPSEEDGYITLTSHNQSAQQINEIKLKEINEKSFKHKALIEGDFPEYAYPNLFELELKIGAQVMFVKNDVSRDKLYFNGKIGKITKIKEGAIYVKCPSDTQEITVLPVEWQNLKFELNASTKEVEEKVMGTFIQYPLKTAWAITIHKSQGLTFEKAIIDANAAFAHGQVYVALSRCKSFEGMVLRSPISYSSIRTDGQVSSYTRNAEKNAPGEEHLKISKINFQQALLFELFDFKHLKVSLFQCKKIGEENYHILNAEFLDVINKIRDQSEKDIYEVAENFKRHLSKQLSSTQFPEENAELQERVKKACVYFTDKFEQIFNKELDKLDTDCDNKAVKKMLTEALENLKKGVFVKVSAIKLGVKGFKTLDYLRIKANAEIDYLNLKTTSPVVKLTSPKNINHGDLYTKLKSWRDQLAADNNIPVYLVLPQKVLLELVQKLPSNFAELVSIKGIGKTKVKQYGNDILMIIQEYCKNKEIPQHAMQLEFAKEKPEKKDTKRLSLELLQGGKTVSEIAEERGLVTSTIESHLIHFVESGELDVFKWLNKTKINQIEDFISENKPMSVTELKNALGEEFSYNEIRAVVKHLAVNATI